MRALSVVAGIAILVNIGCGGGGTAGTPTSPSASTAPVLAAGARAHLEQLLAIMEAGSINRLRIDWPAFRAAVFDAAGSAQTIDELVPAIRVALTRLGDGHSVYRSAAGTTIFVPTRSCSGSGGPASGQLPASIGYVSVSAFTGTPAQATTFADAIRDRIAAQDRDGLAGWIVDLRGNGGGNMWPMIAGLGPILGEGLLGYFIGPTGASVSWFYRDGAALNDDAVMHRLSAPYRLRGGSPRVAVLSDNAVASSGEATLIAFRQRPGTRSFGLASCGLSTSNTTHVLANGAQLVLTTAVMADRTRAVYGDSVVPDEIVADREALWARAVAWLLGA